MDYKPQLLSAVLLLAFMDCIPVRGVPKPKEGQPTLQQREAPCEQDVQRSGTMPTAQRTVKACGNKAVPVRTVEGMRG